MCRRNNFGTTTPRLACGNLARRRDLFPRKPRPSCSPSVTDPQFHLWEPGHPGSYSWKNSERSSLAASHLMPESLLHHVDTVFHILFDYSQNRRLVPLQKGPPVLLQVSFPAYFFSNTDEWSPWCVGNEISPTSTYSSSLDLWNLLLF